MFESADDINAKYLLSRTTTRPVTSRLVKRTSCVPQIVLNPAALRRADRARPAIMPLGSRLAAASVEWRAPVYWVSDTNPAVRLGALLEHFHGAYYQPPNQVCLQVDESRAMVTLSRGRRAPPPAQWLAALARALQMYLSGQSVKTIQRHLNSALKPKEIA